MGEWLGALSQEMGRDERDPSRRLRLSRTSVQKCDAPSQEHGGLSGWEQRPSVCVRVCVHTCACMCACVCMCGGQLWEAGARSDLLYPVRKVCSTAQHAPVQDGRQASLCAFEKDLNWY